MPHHAVLLTVQEQLQGIIVMTQKEQQIILLVIKVKMNFYFPNGLPFLRLVGWVRGSLLPTQRGSQPGL